MVLCLRAAWVSQDQRWEHHWTNRPAYVNFVIGAVVCAGVLQEWIAARSDIVPRLSLMCRASEGVVAL